MTTDVCKMTCALHCNLFAEAAALDKDEMKPSGEPKYPKDQYQHHLPLSRELSASTNDCARPRGTSRIALKLPHIYFSRDSPQILTLGPDCSSTLRARSIFDPNF